MSWNLEAVFVRGVMWPKYIVWVIIKEKARTPTKSRSCGWSVYSINTSLKATPEFNVQSRDKKLETVEVILTLVFWSEGNQADSVGFLLATLAEMVCIKFSERSCLKNLTGNVAEEHSTGFKRTCENKTK